MIERIGNILFGHTAEMIVNVIEFAAIMVLIVVMILALLFGT